MSAQDIACNASISSQRSVDCTATSNAGIMMMFSDSTCTDTNFAGFRYYSMDVCFGISSYYKYECDATDTKKVIKQYYSDSTCTTKDTSNMQTFSTETCMAESGSNSSRRLQSGYYFEVYSGCGEKGTLPAGVKAPADTNMDAGQVSSANVMSASFLLLAASMLVLK
jgi:hypothetical protein